MNKEKSSLPVNYITIKVTKSRIEKGLLAIPVSLINLFPQDQNKIYITDEHGNTELKTFTPYNSSSRECRVGGMKPFYQKYNVKNDDELVIQLLDDNKFRIIPENLFKSSLVNAINKLHNAESENETDINISVISKITNLNRTEVIKNQFVYLSKEKIQDRQKVMKEKNYVNETVPYSMRKLLFELYKGKCQLTGFTFLMKNNKPYFELHHIDANKGNHVKNLLVVSPNIHAQFTYSRLKQFFDEDGWLRQVFFNDVKFSVFQIIDNLSKDFNKEVHF